jgi:hypothetical protein
MEEDLMSDEQKLEEFFSQGPAPVDEQQQLSRRQFLRGGLAGGAAGLAVAAGTGVAVWQISDAELQATLDNADAEIARLQGLVDLYEGLEKVGLDAVLQTGMAAVALPLAAVELGAKTLKSGLDLIEKVLLSLEEALPTAQESILWLEEQVAALAGGVEKLEAALGQVVEKVGDTLVVEALRDFVTMILDNLPFGLGDRIRGVLDGLVGLVTGVDELIAGINTHLLEPLRETWFSADGGQGIQASLLDPLVEHILDPLEEHLGTLATLADTWQQELMAPTQQALGQRAKVRENIAKYKQEHNLE